MNETADSNRIDEIEFEIAALKADIEKRSRVFSQVSIWFSFIALIFSVITGGLSIFDRIIDSVNEEELRRANLVSKIEDIGGETAFFPATNPEAALALAQYKISVNGESKRILSEINQILNERPDDFSSEELISLAVHALNLDRFQEAFEISETILSRPEISDDVRAATLGVQADFLMIRGDSKDYSTISELYDQISVILENSSSTYSPGYLPNIFLNQLQFEGIATKDCDKVAIIANKFRSFIASRPNASAFAPVELEFERIMEEIRKNCP